MAETIFWAALALILYTYVGYPVLLFAAAAARQAVRDLRFLMFRRDARRNGNGDIPLVSLVVSAHNEERCIAEKIRNALALDYPPECIEVVIGSDGSTDGTNLIVSDCSDSRVRLVAFPQRRGKSAALNDLIPAARGRIVVLSDANTMFEPDAVWKLVRHFADPRVGAVCGELRLEAGRRGGRAEALYWRYEQALKFLENRCRAVLGANGGIYAVRRDRFVPFPPSTIVDDFVIPMRIREAGWRVAYDPEAVAREEVAPNIAKEFRRKVRIGAGDFQSLGLTWRLLLPRFGFTAFAFWSHKVLRWCVPFFLLATIGANIALAGRPLYGAFLVGQFAVYGAALAAHCLRPNRARGPLFTVPYYFVTMNLALLVGFIRCVTAAQAAAWEPRATEEPAYERSPSSVS